jgi:quinol monooxygenase YgiN
VVWMNRVSQRRGRIRQVAGRNRLTESGKWVLSWGLSPGVLAVSLRLLGDPFMTYASSVSHSAFVRARQGCSMELGARLGELLEPSRRAPGCMHFALQHSHCDEDLWLVSGFWSSQKAMDDYFASPTMQVFSDVVQAFLVSSLDLHTFHQVAGDSRV